MIKTINKNFLILLFVFISASIFRGVLDQNEYIDNIIALVNVVSLLYVCYLNIEDTKIYFSKLLDSVDYLGDKIKEKKKQYFKKLTNRISIIIIIVGITYVVFFANPIVNDIIGFAALFISIQNSYIAELSGQIIFKKK